MGKLFNDLYCMYSCSCTVTIVVNLLSGSRTAHQSGHPLHCAQGGVSPARLLASCSKSGKRSWCWTGPSFEDYVEVVKQRQQLQEQANNMENEATVTWFCIHLEDAETNQQLLWKKKERDTLVHVHV